MSRIDHEQEALDAAAAGKYDIAQYHATMRLADELQIAREARECRRQLVLSISPADDAQALRTMMGRD